MRCAQTRMICAPSRATSQGETPSTAEAQNALPVPTQGPVSRARPASFADEARGDPRPRRCREVHPCPRTQRADRPAGDRSSRCCRSRRWTPSGGPPARPLAPSPPGPGTPPAQTAGRRPVTPQRSSACAPRPCSRSPEHHSRSSRASAAARTGPRTRIRCVLSSSSSDPSCSRRHQHRNPPGLCPIGK